MHDVAAFEAAFVVFSTSLPSGLVLASSLMGAASCSLVRQEADGHAASPVGPQRDLRLGIWILTQPPTEK